MDRIKGEILGDFIIRTAKILAELRLRPDVNSSESDLNDIEDTYFKSGGRFELVDTRRDSRFV